MTDYYESVTLKIYRVDGEPGQGVPIETIEDTKWHLTMGTSGNPTLTVYEETDEEKIDRLTLSVRALRNELQLIRCNWRNAE